MVFMQPKVGDKLKQHVMKQAANKFGISSSHGNAALVSRQKTWVTLLMQVVG